MEAYAVRDLGLRDAEDEEIFTAARQANAAVMTKDADFVNLLHRYGPPPRILWLTRGNTSNARLREILAARLPTVIEMWHIGDALVEIADAS